MPVITVFFGCFGLKNVRKKDVNPYSALIMPCTIAIL